MCLSTWIHCQGIWELRNPHPQNAPEGQGIRHSHTDTERFLAGWGHTGLSWSHPQVTNSLGISCLRSTGSQWRWEPSSQAAPEQGGEWTEGVKPHQLPLWLQEESKCPIYRRYLTVFESPPSPRPRTGTIPTQQVPTDWRNHFLLRRGSTLFMQ